MACEFPRTVWYDTVAGINPATGKYPISFKPCGSSLDPITIPCGQCKSCRLEKSRQWALRCVLEASLWTKNCFITLTYDDAHLPKDGSLVKKHFQDFMKRLRKKYGPGIRYYHCGEYGSKLGRPHYHACLFNFDFPDKYFFKCSTSSYNFKSMLYRSPSLEQLWPFGFSTIGDVTFESAAYVARYVMKKINGNSAKEHYGNRQPEYTTMSRRPGIAAQWYERYKLDVYPLDCVVMRNGKKLRPPKYFDNILMDDMPDLLDEVKQSRINNMMQKKVEWYYDRILPRELEAYKRANPEVISLSNEAEYEPIDIMSLDASLFVDKAKIEITHSQLSQLRRTFEDEN